MKNCLHAKNKTLIDKGGEMFKSSKIKAIISLIMAFLLASLLVPTLSLRALAVDEADQGQATEQTATSDEQAQDVDSQAIQKAAANNGELNNYDSTKDAYFVKSNSFNVSISITGSGCLIDYYTGYEYYDGDTIEIEDSPIVGDSYEVDNDTLSDGYCYLVATPVDSSVTIESFTFDGAPVIKNTEYEVKEGSEIAVVFKGEPTKYPITANIGQGEIKGEVPADWTDAGSGKYTKDFSAPTTYYQAMQEWKDTEVVIGNTHRTGWNPKPSSDVVSEAKEFTATYTEFDKVTAQFDIKSDYSNILQMEYPEGTKTTSTIKITDVYRTSTWEKQFDQENNCDQIIITNPDGTEKATVKLHLNKKYENISPDFDKDGKTSGTFKYALTKFSGQLKFDKTNVTFNADETSTGRWKVMRDPEFVEKTNPFTDEFPKSLTSYKIKSDSEIHFKVDEPFGNEYIYYLFPNGKANVAYWTVNGQKIIPSEEWVTLEDDITFSAHAYVEPYVSGYVKDAVSDKPIEWANLSLINSDGEILCSTQSKNYPSGFYYLHAPETNDVRVICSKSDSRGTYYDYTSEPFNLTKDNYSLNVKLHLAFPEKSIQLKGTVCDGITQEVQKKTPVQYVDNNNGIYTAVTDKDGKFTLNIPKGTYGYYRAFAQGYTVHNYIFNTDVDQSNYTTDISVYKEDDLQIELLISAKASDDIPNFGEITMNKNGMYEKNIVEYKDVMGCVRGSNVYPTYHYTENEELVVRNIYGEETTYSPKRYGACLFYSWFNGPTPKPSLDDEAITDNSTFRAVFIINEVGTSLKLNANADGFDKFLLYFINSIGSEYSYEVTDSQFEIENAFFIGTTLSRTEDNVFVQSCIDKGEVEGHEYEEYGKCTAFCKEGYEIDKVVFNGTEIHTGDSFTVDSDLDVQITYKKQKTDNTNTESLSSNATGSSSTFDDLGIVVFALLVLLFSSSLLILRNRIKS